jgi:hypothetical protein
VSAQKRISRRQGQRSPYSAQLLRALQSDGGGASNRLWRKIFRFANPYHDDTAGRNRATRIYDSDLLALSAKVATFDDAGERTI